MDEHNMSMEELKVDEDDSVKEISLEEDILGAQSLLMSESEDEDEETKRINKSPLKKLSPKVSHRIVDSDDEERPMDPEKDQNVWKGEQKENVEKIVPKKKISALIDSDSENEESETNKNRNQSDVEASTQDYSEAEEIKQKKKLKSEKKSKIQKSKESKKPKSKPSDPKKKIKKKKLKENEDEHKSENAHPDMATKKISKLVDSDSEEDAIKNSGHDSENELDASARACNFEENNNEEEDPNKKVKNKNKIVRASAKKAMDEMQAIQSEQQRLHREANISIPYHKPKKHTLQDFLNRRTIIKPQSQSNSPVAEVVRNKNLKMTQEELEEYAKLMEERAKEATEFFKSESEEESEEEVFKDNEGILDKQQNTEKSVEGTHVDGPNENDDSKELTMEVDKPANTLEDQKENIDGLQLTEEELAEILAEEEQQKLHEVQTEIHEKPSCSKVLITEVIELPKLDMNTVKISPVKKLSLAPQSTPRPSLSIKQLLATKNLSASPSLSGDPNKLIDLETGDLVERKPTGVENLMQRLMNTVKGRKSKTNETCNILSTENGKLEITKVNISLTDDKDSSKEPKPRAAYFELKKNLKEIIKKKRLEEMHKKQDDGVEQSKCLNGEEEDEEDGATEEEEYEPDSKPKKGDVIEIDEEENALAVEEDEEEEGDEENDNCEDAEDGVIEAEAEDVGDNDDNDEESENGDEDNDNDEDDDDNDEDNDIDEKNNANKSKRNRIIKAFDDSDEEEGDKDDIDFLKTQPPVTQPAIFDTQPSISMPEDEESELMALCSGTFDATQKEPSGNALMSQLPLTQNQGKPVDDDELMGLCSGTFEEGISATQLKDKNVEENIPQPKYNKILSSDEEDDNNESHSRTKKLTKKLKKKTAKLGFSDDEEDGEIESKVSEEDDEQYFDGPEELEEEPATFVDYDSEENEIVVQMTKKDCVKQAATFFEKEAELSESEWGSADEDEKNLDKYDIELGDEDEFDKEKLRSELEQIHARKMLDDDLREVRKIQDMLFEDEEKDGVGRQRQFKWKNAESGFSLDDGKRDENGDGNNGDSGDELNEHQWRKIRYEREQFLKEQGLKPDSQDMSTTLPNTTLLSTSNTTITSTTLISKKLQIITAKKTSASNSDSKKSTPFLISKGIAAMSKKSVRGSFLVRDKETLNKLAGLTKSGAAAANTTDIGGAAGTVSIKSIKPKNFVFATLTEEEHENRKRKADDLLNSSNENGTNFMKKPKIEPRRDKCFIDQLL